MPEDHLLRRIDPFLELSDVRAELKQYHARDVARALAGSEAFEQSRCERKKLEMPFAHLKRILRLGRLRLRGPTGAGDEFLLAASARNLGKLAKLVWKPPENGKCAPA